MAKTQTSKTESKPETRATSKTAVDVAAVAAKVVAESNQKSASKITKETKPKKEKKEESVVPESTVALFYFPILWMCSHLKPVYVLFEWYADLWRG